MTNYRDIVTGEEELLEINDNQQETKAMLVGKPLYLSGELFKTILSNILGFAWLYNLSLKLPLPNFKLYLPTISYYYGYAYSRLNSTQRYVAHMLGYENKIVSGFAIGLTNYYVNPINFLLIPLNYIARNLGKALGWLLVSPWTIPAYLTIKSIYTIKKSIQTYNNNRALAAIDTDKLASGWLTDSRKYVSARQIAKHVGVIDFTTHWLNAVKEAHFSSATLKEEKLNSYFTAHWLNTVKEAHFSSVILKEKLNSYQQERRKILSKDKRNQIINMVIFAALLTPISLCITIPNYIRSQKERDQEIQLLNLFSDPSNNHDMLSGTKNLYEMGELCQKDMPQTAFAYYSAIDEKDNHYTNAMQNCGEMLFADGMIKEAENYFKASQDSRMEKMCHKLNQGKKTLGEIYVESDSDSDEISATEDQSSFAKWQQNKQSESANPQQPRATYARFHAPSSNGNARDLDFAEDDNDKHLRAKSGQQGC